MTDMVMALLALRQIAPVTTQSELDAARMEAADILDQAGWEKSARTVIDSIGRSVADHHRERPSR